MIMFVLQLQLLLLLLLLLHCTIVFEWHYYSFAGDIAFTAVADVAAADDAADAVAVAITGEDPGLYVPKE